MQISNNSSQNISINTSITQTKIGTHRSIEKTDAVFTSKLDSNGSAEKPKSAPRRLLDRLTNPRGERLNTKVADKIAKETTVAQPQDQGKINALAQIKTIHDNPAEKHRKDDFYKICACEVAYQQWDKGVVLTPGGEIGPYTIDDVMTNDKGLQIVILKPTKEGDPPILCCRGTKELHNVADDLGKRIGMHGFESSAEDIKSKLYDLSLEHGPVVIVGHSLGGALAQVITANFSGSTITNQDGESSLIKETHHFDAPGVGKEFKEMYKKDKESLSSRGIKTPEVISLRHINDIVSLSGGAHIEPDKHLDVGDQKFIGNPLKIQLEAHTQLQFVSQYYAEGKVIERMEGKKPFLQRVFQKIAESARRGAGIVFKNTIANIADKKAAQKEVESRIATEIQQQQGRGNIDLTERTWVPAAKR